jgi:hypothetical protein
VCSSSSSYRGTLLERIFASPWQVCHHKIHVCTTKAMVHLKIHAFLLLLAVLLFG